MRLDFQQLGNIVTLAGYDGEASVASVALTSARAFWMYVGLMLWPFGLCPDHLVRLSTSLFEPATLLAWLALGGAGLSSALLARRTPLAVFGFWWLVIHYLPVSNLIPSAFILADRYMYIPSMGFCLMLACAGDAAARGLERRGFAFAHAAVAACALGLVVFYGARTLGYSQHWLDARSIWEYTARCNPRSFRAYNGLGLDAMAAGQLESAIGHYTLALERKPRFSQAYNNRAICHGQLGRLDEAQADFAAAIRVNPNNADAHYNLGFLHSLRREADAARASYARAAELGHPAAQQALQALSSRPEG